MFLSIQVDWMGIFEDISTKASKCNTIYNFVTIIVDYKKLYIMHWHYLFFVKRERKPISTNILNMISFYMPCTYTLWLVVVWFHSIHICYNCVIHVSYYYKLVVSGIGYYYRIQVYGWWEDITSLHMHISKIGIGCFCI